MSKHLTSLTEFTTFGLPARAEQILTADSSAALLSHWQAATARRQPVLILGGGSNVLFMEDFAGSVILNRIPGIQVDEDEESWHLHVGAGENWHDLVRYTLDHGMAGLENLALIPGCVGSAPIQNIGAYGVELQHVCDYVDAMDLRNGTLQRLPAAACGFGYRESIFKHRYRDGYAIVAVGLRLSKRWQPMLSYGDLTRLDAMTATPRAVFDAVCHMRRTKLPDPAQQGNAGSFFKNPVVSAEAAEAIRARYPQAPCYPQENGEVKLAAGWLIDRCELKGYQIGGAVVHRQQALVLINQHQASAQDVIALARYVRRRVGEAFSVWLEPEVRFIAAQGEVNAVEVLS
ncbi:UDP-N-acetylmuramate dehydrogenase [Edwardsiella piscicida]|uniref:UDP-N-acetylmuramate dehydrogenase n=1 Tax=Edwardsiella piscicida TaxID=1263550 RepID=UPI0002C060B5|nr:UDP-N-acetylmuramate dehydrogenase [Edwardsiella piscicida]AGH72267.1 UDP-N-acetylenolpyruvoylglucosamine reductase [Edwardsiella piscicida C07-087]EKS7781704.1 UDP-N-acetylmuramate dehydrogenase [Edwardsiella piscicida]EKS7785095.1 UDP-N-acetylmuramate dehydrogenase [Edwardsiella piscicida]EKS7795108.1 UDP-N-acetylmuramate dehydrogenase [Edwardsiella piscicida]ELM3730575.1 UDP-N-acetylmuramate dehydrogenase [Edwardsiella piscicida]